MSPPSLTIGQLFTPLSSGVVPGVTPVNVAPGTWLYTWLQNAGALGLPVTSWQSGGVAWTEAQITSAMMAVSDGNISLIAQAGFLDFCATGAVTFVNAQGVSVTVPVTPDPSIPSQNPTGALGWLDVLSDSGYGNNRVLATFASGSLQLVNTSGNSFGSYVVGGFHVANNFTNQTYTNTAAFTYSASTSVGTNIASVAYGSTIVITTNSAHGLSTGAYVYISGVNGLSSNWAAITVTSAQQFQMNNVSGSGSYSSGGLVWVPQAVPFQADLIGPGSNAAVGQVSITTTSVPGGFVWNPTAWSGTPYESNTALVARDRATLQSVSPNGAKGAYTVLATTAATVLAARSPPQSLTQAITRAVVSTSTGTGIVTTTVANASGAVPGVVGVLVTGATQTAPVVLTVTTTAGMVSGMNALVSGVLGTTGVNGYWVITVLTGTTLSLNGSIGVGGFTGNGVISVGDLGLVDSVLQATATPNAVTELTQSATALSVNVTATVYVPNAFLADYGTTPSSNKGSVALTAYFPTIPIGGLIVPGAASGVVDYSAISDVIFDAGTAAGQKYTISVQSLTLNGVAASVALTGSQVATLGTVNLSVIGV